MIRILRILALVLCLGAGCSLLAPRAFAQDNSTPEERARVVAITRKLESGLLDKDLHQEREWALKRMIEVKDIHIALCPSVLGDFLNSKYKYKGDITTQLMLASAAFVIENPDKAGDANALNQSALTSVLKAYESILKDKPKDKSKDLDVLLQKRDSGQLVQAVQENGKSCGLSAQ